MLTGGEDMKAKRLTMCALFAAMTAVCAQVVIPLGAAPVSLALLPVLLGTALLPRRYALASVGVYLLMGLAGLPVFARMTGGPGVLLGPTGGYLVGYAACAWLAALLREKGVKLWLALTCGVAACYVPGIIWLMAAGGFPLRETMLTGVAAFIPGDILKVLITLMLTRRLAHAVK